jgi:ABC-type uncharacterized transport system permease subunit
MNWTILAYLATALLYAGLAAHFWRTRWSKATEGHGQSAATAPWERGAVVFPLVMHAALLYYAALAGPHLVLGVGIAVSIIVWLSVLIYWIGSFVHRVEGLQALVMPIAAAACLLPLVVPSARELPNTDLFAFKAHLIISMLAYSFFTLASLHALLMALLERRLHDGRIGTARNALPPLLTMESILFRLIAAGFVLLTLSLVSGILFSEELFGRPLSFNHKTVFGIVSWLIFGALLAGHALYGWRGRTAMRWTLAGFVTLVLAYLGSRFVVEVLLQRGA